MKILHLLSQRPDSTGSGVFLQALLREATAVGHENFLVAGVNDAGDQHRKLIAPQHSRFLHFPSGDLPFPLPGMSDVMPYNSTRFREMSAEQLDRYESVFSEIVRQAVVDFEPDIIHSHHLWLLTSLARQLFPEIPLVTSSHGSDLRQFRNCPHLRERVLAGCQSIDRVMALSEAQREDIIGLYGLEEQQVVVTGAGYDSNLFYPEPKTAPPPVKLLYAGKLSRAKGVPWLLRALRRFESPDWKLHLIGDGGGEEKQECLTLAGELGQRVQLHGALPQSELARLLRQSDLFLLPSFYEGLPLVTLEALACGCRVVTTDLPGNRAIIGGVETDLIELVTLPRLQSVDRPLVEDEKQFELNLTTAIEVQLERINSDRPPDRGAIQERLDFYSWSGLFSRVNAVYREMISSVRQKEEG